MCFSEPFGINGCFLGSTVLVLSKYATEHLGGLKDEGQWLLK
jgi:hypothetical protein